MHPDYILPEQQKKNADLKYLSQININNNIGYTKSTSTIAHEFHTAKHGSKANIWFISQF